MKTKPFDLARAIAGDPVVTRAGYKATYASHNAGLCTFEIHAGGMYANINFDHNGHRKSIYGSSDRLFDLFMLDTDTSETPATPLNLLSQMYVGNELPYRVVNIDGKLLGAFPERIHAETFMDHPLRNKKTAMLEEDYIAQQQQQQSPVFVPNTGETFFSVMHFSTGFEADNGYVKHGPTSFNTLMFRTKEAAEAYAKVLNLEMLLMSQPGREAPDDTDKLQWYIEIEDGNVLADDGSSLEWLINHGQFGIWSSEEAADNAIQTVGADNIRYIANYRAGLIGSA